MSWHLGDATLLAERGVLLVTAHPDDEAMFFVPTILALQAHGVVVHVLCLSTGDYDGLGAVRSAELVRSCASLDVAAERVTLIDDARLRDGPDEIWDSALVASLVRRELRQHALAAVVALTEGAKEGTTVCVIDPGPNFMHSWDTRFRALEINHVLLT